MGLFVKHSGSWKSVKSVYVKQSGVWKPVKQIYVKQSGAWKPVWQSSSLRWIRLRPKSGTVIKGAIFGEYHAVIVYTTPRGYASWGVFNMAIYDFKQGKGYTLSTNLSLPSQTGRIRIETQYQATYAYIAFMSDKFYDNWTRYVYASIPMYGQDYLSSLKGFYIDFKNASSYFDTSSYTLSAITASEGYTYAVYKGSDVKLVIMQHPNHSKKLMTYKVPNAYPIDNYIYWVDHSYSGVNLYSVQLGYNSGYKNTYNNVGSNISSCHFAPAATVSNKYPILYFEDSSGGGERLLFDGQNLIKFSPGYIIGYDGDTIVMTDTNGHIKNYYNNKLYTITFSNQTTYAYHMDARAQNVVMSAYKNNGAVVPYDNGYNSDLMLIYWGPLQDQSCSSVTMKRTSSSISQTKYSRSSSSTQSVSLSTRSINSGDIEKTTFSFKVEEGLSDFDIVGSCGL